MVKRATSIPLYLQIEEEIRDLVRSGELGPLAQVPSEIELSERFEVSRMTARKALDGLVRDGILFRRQGKGTFVAPAKIGHDISTKLSFTAAMRALGLRHGTTVLEAGIAPAPKGVSPSVGESEGAPVVFLRRLRSVEGEPAAIHLAYLPSRFAGILEGDLTGSLTDLMAGVGARVARSQDTAEAVPATGEEARLLGISPGAPLIRVEGVAFSADRQPLRYTEALYRGDRFRFSIDTTNADNLGLDQDTPGAKDRIKL